MNKIIWHKRAKKQLSKIPRQTQIKIFNRADIPLSSVARMEKADKPARTAILKKLANAMNITVEQLND